MIIEVAVVVGWQWAVLVEVGGSGVGGGISGGGGIGKEYGNSVGLVKIAVIIHCVLLVPKTCTCIINGRTREWSIKLPSAASPDSTRLLAS